MLILAEDMTVLLLLYSTLHHDARMGRVEAVTSRHEAARLLQTFQPDVLVLDASVAGSAGLAAALVECKLTCRPKVVVTCDERDGLRVREEARAIGAVGLLHRDHMSVQMIVRAYEGPASARTQGTATTTA